MSPLPREDAWRVLFRIDEALRLLEDFNLGLAIAELREAHRLLRGEAGWQEALAAIRNGETAVKTLQGGGK